MVKELIDIKENNLVKYDKKLLPILLKDNTSNKNIIWATDNYIALGEEYSFFSQIQCELITGKNGNIIKPRVSKGKEEQISRTKRKAEVFTPSWICNNMNNLVDNSWFESENMFNTETEKGWVTNLVPIQFSDNEGKTWPDYIKSTRLEITCGEAPYLVSRYDTITGQSIAVVDRIGMLDRKLRVISENANAEDEWYNWAVIAFQSIYGYEWQGDSLLLARENLLFTFIDYYEAKFHKEVPIEYLKTIAEVISWNIWQMDGLKYVIPNSCKNKEIVSEDLFGNKKTTVQPCEGCKKNDAHKHNGIYCKIKDWSTGKTLEFVSLLKS